MSDNIQLLIIYLFTQTMNDYTLGAARPKVWLFFFFVGVNPKKFDILKVARSRITQKKKVALSNPKFVILIFDQKIKRRHNFSMNHNQRNRKHFKHFCMIWISRPEIEIDDLHCVVVGGRFRSVRSFVE